MNELRFNLFQIIVWMKLTCSRKSLAPLPASQQGPTDPAFVVLGSAAWACPPAMARMETERVIRFIADYGYKRTFMGKQLDLGKMSSS
jgi:hypothetical protein